MVVMCMNGLSSSQMILPVQRLCLLAADQCLAGISRPMGW